MSTVRSNYLKPSAPAFGHEEIDELLGAIDSGWVTTGPRVATLERDLERYLGAPHVRCLSSLHRRASSLALRLSRASGPATRC